MTDDLPTGGIGVGEIELEEFVRADQNVELDDVPGAAAAFRELAGLVLAQGTLAATMTRIADLVSDIVPGAGEASITLVREQRPATVAFSKRSRLAHVLDERQYELGEGPCLDAAVSGRTIHIPDTSAHQLYPVFARSAHRAGAGATLAIGLPTIQRVTGAVNIYGYLAPGSGGFDQRSLAVASGFAAYVGVALTNASLYAGAVAEVTQMQEAMASRAAIEQAKGLLMGQYRCDSEQAFDILRELSMRSNRKLRDVARELLAAAVKPGPA
jgi:GAF domain-containing protein